MSELTKCNFCTLNTMRKAASKRAARVDLQHNPNGTIKAIVSDAPGHAAAIFMSLTDHCVCAD